MLRSTVHNNNVEDNGAQIFRDVTFQAIAVSCDSIHTNIVQNKDY